MQRSTNDMIFARTFSACVFALWATAAAASIPIPDDYEPPYHPEGKPLEGLVITVDPGHGGSSFSEGYHGSARGINSRVVEGDLNMLVSGLVYHHLKDAGAEVHLTRRDDRKVTLGDTGRAEELGARTDVAEETRSHLFLSIHHNSAPRRTAHGVVILIWPTDSEGEDQPLERAFADIMREELMKMVPWEEEFGHYMIEHPLVMNSDLPSAVLEYGFLSNAEFDEWVSGPTAHKTEAIATYNGVVRMWQEHREELEALRDRLLPPPDEEPEPKTEDENAFPLGRPLGSVWGLDRPARTAEELRFAVDTWRHSRVTDRNTMYVDASVEENEDGGFALTGWAFHPNLREGVATQLSRAAGTEIDNGMELLPDLPDGVSPFGIVDIPMALTWGEPREGAWVQTQLLYGEPLFLLRRDASEQYFLVMGIDGYTGWVRKDAVRHLDRDEFTELMTGPAARVVQNTMKDDFRIPPASRVMVEEVNGESVAVTLADGSSWEMPAESLHLPPETSPGEIAARTALDEYLYTPYLFGGRSTLGLDCSGLSGAVWAAAGAQLPRDAHQQSLVGQLVATPWYKDALQPGDVLFFIDRSGRVIHSGISLGGLDFIHASPPEVHISSLDPDSEHYSATWAEAFATARRPMP